MFGMHEKSHDYAFAFARFLIPRVDRFLDFAQNEVKNLGYKD